MHGLPVIVGLAGFEIHGLAADRAERRKNWIRHLAGPLRQIRHY